MWRLYWPHRHGDFGGMNRRICVVVAAAASLALPAAAQQLPNATDLRAAYCAQLLSRQVPLQRQFVAIVRDLPDSPQKRKAIADAEEAEARQNRIIAYLRPRVPHLDVGPLIAARETAASDIEAIGRLTEHCKCNDLEATLSCAQEATAASQIPKQQQQCASLEWLPF
jgi:hypothetical protein